jgi:hypothetical protein
MDVPPATAPIVPVPYPKVSQELRILSFGIIAPALKRMTRKLQGLQSILHIACIKNQVLPDHDKEYAILNAAFNSIAGFDDGSDTPKTYKDVLNHNNPNVWWDSMKEEFHAMETKAVWEIILMSSMPPGRKVIANRWVYNEKDDGTLRSQTFEQVFCQVPGQDFTNSHAPVMTDLAL